MGERDDLDEFGEPTSEGAAPASGEQKLMLLVMVAGGVTEVDLGSRRGQLTVGRSPNAEVHIDAPSVSRAHALITVDGARVTVEDLQSTNKTFVNGTAIGAQPLEIHVGDAIRFGDVVAQLRGARASRIFVPRFLREAEFEARVGEEAERCVRYDRDLAAIAIETAVRDPRTAGRARQVVAAGLRALDAACERVPGRIDVLVAECAKAEAVAIARRMQAELESRGIEARVGVASYPQDAPSLDSLLVAAQFAMHSATSAAVGVSAEGYRQMRIGERDILVAEPAMVKLFGLIERLAGGAMPVLVTGETGSGKDIVADAIHALGPRAAGPLVKLNCAAIAEGLLESELFGHEKGAFSGADVAKCGLFEEADRGTFFLDEIGEMSLPLQAKLLRVLEDRKVRRVGSTRERSVDVRIICATNRDLRAEAAAGRFREDLYYRLSAFVLRVPPLRERPREIGLLAARFAVDAFEQMGRQPVPVGPAAVKVLQAYPWPGNVRELRNAMHGAAMLCEGLAIEAEHLPAEIAGGAEDGFAGDPLDDPKTVQVNIGAQSLEDEVRDVVRARIVQALEECGGNQTRAAELLAMPRRTLVSKIASLGIDVSRWRKGARVREP